MLVYDHKKKNRSFHKRQIKPRLHMATDNFFFQKLQLQLNKNEAIVAKSIYEKLYVIMSIKNQYWICLPKYSSKVAKIAKIAKISARENFYP